MLIRYCDEPQILSYTYDSILFQKKKITSTAFSMPSLIDLKSPTTTKCNSYFANSVATTFIQPDIHRHLTINVPDHICYPLFISFHWFSICPRIFVWRRIVRNSLKSQHVVKHLFGWTRLPSQYTIEHTIENNHYTDNGNIWAKKLDSLI